MPNKRHCRFGIKKFELCESSTGYVLHIELYAGKDFNIRSDAGQGTAIVMHLMTEANLLGKGYHLVTDNFYTKVLLAQELLFNRTLLTGTVRANSRHFPQELKQGRHEVGAITYMRSDNGILALAFREKKSHRKPVLLLSTFSTIPANVEAPNARGRVSVKPEVIRIYNKNMGGVDMMDRKIYQIAAERTTRRYWVNIFWNLVDISIRNAYEL